MKISPQLEQILCVGMMIKSYKSSLEKRKKIVNFFGEFWSDETLESKS